MWRSILILILVLTLPALVAYFVFGAGHTPEPTDRDSPEPPGIGAENPGS